MQAERMSRTRGGQASRVNYDSIGFDAFQRRNIVLVLTGHYALAT